MATEVEPQTHIEFHTHDGVGLIRFNRPEKMNAIGALTRQQLGEAIKQAERDDAVRVVVLTGSGRAFSSGADVTEMVQGAGMRTPEDVGNVLRNEYMPMLARLRTMPKPVIAAMNGPAVGIGASFALACDIRIATPEAYLLEAFVNIGLAPDGGVSWLLPRLAGTGVAYEMFFSGKPLQAADAHRLGVINRIVPAERLEQDDLSAEAAVGRGDLRARGAGADDRKRRRLLVQQPRALGVQHAPAELEPEDGLRD